MSEHSMKPPQLFTIPAGTRSSSCVACQATIYRVGKQPLRAVPRCHYLAKRAVIETPDAVPPSLAKDGKGFSHFIDCPNAAQFRRT